MVTWYQPTSCTRYPRPPRRGENPPRQSIGGRKDGTEVDAEVEELLADGTSLYCDKEEPADDEVKTVTARSNEKLQACPKSINKQASEC